MKYMLYAASAVLALVLAWIILAWEPGADKDPKHQILELSERPTGGDFTLQSWRGPVSLADFRGGVVLLYFGYTWCPDVCPTNLGYVGMAMDRLSAAEQERVQVLFISVDPQRDTLEKLKQYTAFFHPRVLGITGEADQISRVARLYGAAYRKVQDDGSAAGYLVDHSAYTYLIGPDGRLRGQLDHATPPDRIVEAVRRLLPANPSG